MIRSMTRVAGCAALCTALLAASAGWAQEAKQLRIVKQPGLGYLQLIVMREQKTLEKRLPGVEVEWRQLTSGPVIRDAMVAGQMDVGSGGVGPFVQAIDKGVDWKALGALNEMPLYLNCARADIKSLKDVKPGDRMSRTWCLRGAHRPDPGRVVENLLFKWLERRTVLRWGMTAAH